MIRAGQRQGSGAVQQIIQVAEIGVVEGEAEQCVFDDGVVHRVFTALPPQGGVLFNGDTLVVDDNACGGLLDLFGQLGHDSLLLR